MYLVPKRLFGAAILLAGLAQGASAASVSISIDTFGMTNLSGAQAAYATYLTGTRANVVEDFESFTPWGGLVGTANPVETNVGTFKAVSASNGGPGGSSVNSGSGLEVRADNGVGNSSDGTLWGRQNSTDGGENWLDSNDLTSMVWTIDASTGFGRFDSLAFMLGDVEVVLDELPYGSFVELGTKYMDPRENLRHVAKRAKKRFVDDVHKGLLAAVRKAST